MTSQQGEERENNGGMTDDIRALPLPSSSAPLVNTPNSELFPASTFPTTATLTSLSPSEFSGTFLTRKRTDLARQRSVFSSSLASAGIGAVESVGTAGGGKRPVVGE